MLEGVTAGRLLALFEAMPAPTRAFAAALQPARADPAARIRSVDQPQALDHWLVLLIAGLFLGERLLAGSAPRRPPPAAGADP